ncbi:MAG: hypothetical protein GY710_00290 [Desulfobacteraceae bacterium]|nr:hypothetical protein [Desulfobacteraceae bacterium]
MDNEIEIFAACDLNQNMLFTTSRQKRIDGFIESVLNPKSKIGIVDQVRCPLISTLSVAENIVLWNMYHENVCREDALELIMPFIISLGFEKKIHGGKQLLNNEELFNAGVLRCITSKKQVVLFDSPEPYDIYVLLNWLTQMDLDLKIWICCLIDKAAIYDRMSLKTVDLLKNYEKSNKT